MRCKTFFLSLLFLLLIVKVSALAVSPAGATYDFKPDAIKEGSFVITNSGGKECNLDVELRGDVGQYIFVEDRTIHFSEGEGAKEVSYRFIFPRKMPPGVHEGEVVISQQPKTENDGGNSLSARVAVVYSIKVYVPYPGKYANAKLLIESAKKKGDNVIFTIPVVSAGKFDLSSVMANIDIYNKENKKIDTLNTDRISIASGEKKDLVAKWKADVSLGDYHAKVNLIYDGNVLPLEGDFKVGIPYIELQGVEVKNFKIGGVAKFEMLVENQWSKKIKGVYSETKVYDKEGNLMTTFKSPTYDVRAFSKNVLVSYWDTSGIKPGTYNTEISLKYLDKVTPTNLKLKVSEDSIEIVGLGYVISSGGELSGSLTTILIVGIIVLILINLLWFLVIRRLLKRKRK